MNCPDWPALAAHRYTTEAKPPRGWQKALGHAEACPSCRRRALAADPTLVFRRLVDEPLSATEVDGIRAGVEALRGAKRVERSRRRRLRRYGSVAAALLLATGAVLLAPGVIVDDPTPLETPRAESSGAMIMRFGDQRVPALDLATPPMIEALDRPEARIYQLPQDDLSLVMIVDESLDV